jgi:hypothetical protein
MTMTNDNKEAMERDEVKCNGEAIRNDVRTGFREGAIDRAAKHYAASQNLNASLMAAYEEGYLAAKYENFALSDRWIEIKSWGLPQDAGRYLVRDRMCNPKHCVHIAYWSVDHSKWTALTNSAGDGAANQNITHWMPIPTPPAAEGGE